MLLGCWNGAKLFISHLPPPLFHLQFKELPAFPEEATGRCRQVGGLWTQVKAAHLGVFEDVHDEDGEAQPKNISHETGVEVRVRVPLEAVREGNGRYGDLGAGKASLTARPTP